MKVMAMIKRVELIDKFEFVKAALDKDAKIYIMHIATLENIVIYLSRALLLVTLQKNKVPTEIPKEYTVYTNVFWLT